MTTNETKERDEKQNKEWAHSDTHFNLHESTMHLIRSKLNVKGQYVLF